MALDMPDDLEEGMLAALKATRRMALSLVVHGKEIPPGVRRALNTFCLAAAAVFDACDIAGTNYANAL